MGNEMGKRTAKECIEWNFIKTLCKRYVNFGPVLCRNSFIHNCC